MASHAGEPASVASIGGPFLRGKAVLFLSRQRKIDIGDTFVRISHDLRFTRASPEQQDAVDFSDCDVIVELQRVTNIDDDLDDESLFSDKDYSSEALADSTLGALAPHPAHDNHTVALYGCVTVRDRDQGTESERRCVRCAGCRAVWLIASSREERDVWLLMLRARVAPVRLWHAICRTHAKNCGPESYNRLRSFFHERSTQASQRDIAEALLRERSRWARETASPSGQRALAYPEGSAEDVSDAALLLCTSVMLVMELSTRVGAAASMNQFEIWHEGTVVLCRIKDSSKVVCAAVHVVVSAAMAGVRDTSMSSVVDALMGCWDCLLVAESSLLEISSTRTITDDAKESLQATRRTIQDHAVSASVAQLAMTPQESSKQDGAYQASFRVDLPYSLAAAKEGSAQYDRVIDELLNTDATDDHQPIAVTSVSGEGGAGKTTTCMLALCDSRVKAKYDGGMFAFEIGVDAQGKDVIQKITSMVKKCGGFATGESIHGLTDVREAARQARHFFAGRRILLYLDNVWPDSRGLKDLISIASEVGSCVLFSTRSKPLAEDYTDRVVELGTLRLDVPVEKAAAAAIFDKHVGPQRDHRWCSEENVDRVLSISQGLPIAIATLAALVKNKLARRTTMNLLGQVAANLGNPHMSSSRNLEHKGLFAAMAESLDFLDRQWADNINSEGGPQGLMTRRYASLHAVVRSGNRIDKHVLAIVWNTSVEDAEATAGEFFSLGLARLAPTHADSTAEENEGLGSETLTLHDLQVEYSGHVALSGRHGIKVEEVHETVVRGIFEDSVDIDALTAHDYERRCLELRQTNENSDDLGGRYVASNLVRHLIGSLTPQNTPRRWSTIVRLLSYACWLFMWQRVDGWQHVYSHYITIRDQLPSTEILESLSSGEVEIVSEIGRAAREVPCKERMFPEGKETEKAAADLFRRVHAIWQEETENTTPSFIEPILCSLYQAAGEWWLRPSTACHGRATRHNGLLLQFRVPQAMRCALIGDDGHVAVTSMDSSVRLSDMNGMLVDSHSAHSMVAAGVCVGRRSCDAELRLFSVSHDGTLVLWDITLPNSTVGHVRTADPIVVDKVEDKLWAAACTTDGRVIVAGSAKGGVYLWVLNDNESASEYSRRTLAREHTAPIRSVAVSPDGATVVSGSEDRTCRVWRIAGAVRDGAGTESCAVLKKEGEEEDREGEVWSCAFADEGRVVVTGHRGGAVRIWHVGRDTPLHEVKLGEDTVYSLAAIGDAGREVVAGTATGTAHVVRVRDGAVTAEIGRADFDIVRSVSASRGSRRMVACTHESGRVELWDLERLLAGPEADASTPGCEDQPRRASRVFSVSASPCGRIVASGHEDGSVRCWSGRSGRCVWEYEHESSVFCVCVSANAAHIACGCWDGVVLVLDARSGSIARRWQHSRAVYSVTLYKLSDGLVWSGHWNGEVAVWSMSQDSPAHMRAEHNATVDNLAVSVGGLSAYARDKSGCISHLRIVGSEVEVEQVAPASEEPDFSRPNGALFAELTAHGHRTAGNFRMHARVRHEMGGETHDVSVRLAEHWSGVDVDLEIPNSAHVIKCIADFDSSVFTLDAVVSPDVDKDRGFAQIVCGLNDGRVCILWQPLTLGSVAYDAVQSWERFVADVQSASVSSVRDEQPSQQPNEQPSEQLNAQPSEQPRTPVCFGCFGSLMSSLRQR